MEMSGEQRIEAPRSRVWEALNDPAILQACIPGCQSLVVGEDGRMQAVAAIKVGPIGARFQGVVQLLDLNPPESYRIQGEGQGGMAGFANGEAKVQLREDGPDATILSYEVSARVGGKLAQVGGALIDATAKQMASAFFRKFGQRVNAVEAEPAIQHQPHTAAAASGSVHAAARPAEAASPVPPVAAANTQPASTSHTMPVIPTRERGAPWKHLLLAAALLIVGFLLGRGSVSSHGMVVTGAPSDATSVGLLLLLAALIGYFAGRDGGDRGPLVVIGNDALGHSKDGAKP